MVFRGVQMCIHGSRRTWHTSTSKVVPCWGFEQPLRAVQSQHVSCPPNGVTSLNPQVSPLRNLGNYVNSTRNGHHREYNANGEQFEEK
jgi:hypothetical protein